MEDAMLRKLTGRVAWICREDLTGIILDDDGQEYVFSGDETSNILNFQEGDYVVFERGVVTKPIPEAVKVSGMANHLLYLV